MTRALDSAGRVPVWTVGDRVRKARESADMQQTELAELAGVSRGTLGNIENGRTTPRRASLIAIAFATGVSLEWLENGENPRPENPGGGVDELVKALVCAIRDSNPEPAGLGLSAVQAA